MVAVRFLHSREWRSEISSASVVLRLWAFRVTAQIGEKWEGSDYGAKVLQRVIRLFSRMSATRAGIGWGTGVLRVAAFL